MSKGIINALKSKVKELEYKDLRAKRITSKGWGEIDSGTATYLDLKRIYGGIIINNRNITSEFINELYLKHKDLIAKGENGEENYRLFLKAVFTEMFEHTGATVPNDLIVDELITNYHQGGYTGFFKLFYNMVLGPCDLIASCSERISIHIECNDPDYLRCFSSTENVGISYSPDNWTSLNKLCDLSSSVEFKLKYKDGNVAYEDGKILLTIPKELENYEAGGDSLLDKLIDLINKVVEYCKKLCKKLGFEFDTKIGYDSESNIKIEHNFGKPLKVVNEPGIHAVNGLKPKAQ